MNQQDDKAPQIPGAAAFPRRLPQALAAFGHRDYRWLWCGMLASNTGGWMHKVATGWLVYKYSGSELWLGLDAFASGLPTVILLPWGGVLADRMDRRTLLMATNVLAALFALGLAAADFAHVLQVQHIVLVSFLTGVVNAAMVPANQSLLPSLVGKDDLHNAIALNALQFNLTRVIGPALGGIVFVALGAAWSFTINAGSYLVLVVALLFIRHIPAAHKIHEPVLRSLGSGLRYLGTRWDILTMIVLVLLTAFCSAPAVSMLPVLVKDVFNRDSGAFAMLLSAFGAGAVIGAVALAVRSGRPPTPWRAFGLLIVLGACEIGLSRAGQYGLAAVLIGLSGMMLIATMVRLGAAVLHSTPDQYRGRVMSFHTLAFRAGQPTGSLTAGAIATGMGITFVFALYGLTLIVAVTALLLLARRLGIRYQPDTETDGADPGDDNDKARSS